MEGSAAETLKSLDDLDLLLAQFLARNEKEEIPGKNINFTIILV